MKKVSSTYKKSFKIKEENDDKRAKNQRLVADIPENMLVYVDETGLKKVELFLTVGLRKESHYKSYIVIFEMCDTYLQKSVIKIRPTQRT